MISYANVTASSSTDIELDIQISHNGGANFISLLDAPVIIPATTLICKGPTITFAQGAYLRNFDLVYATLTSAAFDGGSITLELLFQ